MAESRPTPAAASSGLESLDVVVARVIVVAGERRITESEVVSTFDAPGRVLAEGVRSTLDVPPADNTAMDGYAMRAADVPAAGTRLPVSQRIPAGVVGTRLEPGTAARIFTGAQVPPGADAVVMQEQCSAEPTVGGKGLGHVIVNTVPQPGQWVRRRGEDVQQGTEVLAAGLRLSPQAAGLAASVGAATLTVCRRPKVALFSTGDELAMPGELLKPGAIYNSNRFTLRGLVQAAGCEVVDLGIVPDNLAATRDALQRAAAVSDLILTCGGVSVGEEDYLKPAVQAEGWLIAWQVAMKPGKPLAFGAIKRATGTPGETLFIGLPGNPVSSFVTFLLVVAPALRALQGCTRAQPPALSMRADFDWPRPDRRREFLRARFNAEGGLDLFPNQSSGVLTSTVWADGLIDNPGGQAIARGDTVRFLPLSTLIGA